MKVVAGVRSAVIIEGRDQSIIGIVVIVFALRVHPLTKILDTPKYCLSFSQWTHVAMYNVMYTYIRTIPCIHCTNICSDYTYKFLVCHGSTFSQTCLQKYQSTAMVPPPPMKTLNEALNFI